MKPSIVPLLLAAGLIAARGFSQDVIPLYPQAPAGAREETSQEKQYFSKTWNTEVVSNVSKPSLTVYRPASGASNGTAVVVCPGGGFMALSIKSEGSDVAKWLAVKGVTAFVLKYRLAHTGDDATQEFMSLYQDKQKFGVLLAKVVPQSVADGLAAVTYVRTHAAEYGVVAEKVGIVGFSAGGTVTTAVALHYKPEGRPAFAAPIYPATELFKDTPVPPDAPPMFIAAASDDQLGLTMDSINLYDRWFAARKPVELHMYEKGGHGFGMRQQSLPSDHWIERLADWMTMNGWLKQPAPSGISSNR